MSCLNSQSYLSDGTIFTKYIVHVLGVDVKRQVSDVQDSVDLGRKTNLER